MANKRIFWAHHQVGLKADGDTGDFTEIHGVQSVGMTTNFNLVQVFELGQLALYENIEEVPDIQVTLNKVLDGYPLMYSLATLDATDPTLPGRSNAKSIFGMSIFDDTAESATGTPGSIVQCSGMFVGSVGYNFNEGDNFSEDITLVGNDKVWLNDPHALATLPSPDFDGAFDGTDSPIGTGGVNRRQDFIWDYSGGTTDVNGAIADSDCSVLPPEVFGISSSGTNEKTNGQDYDAHVQSVTVSCDFGRQALNELGRKGPYHRFLTFPVEVRCEVTVISTSGDLISATEDGIYTTGNGQCEDAGNLVDRTIRIATCEGTRLYLGTKNKLASVNHSGGDTGGGNVTVTYSFRTFNDLTVMHSGDPNSNFVWADRDDYLQDLP